MDRRDLFNLSPFSNPPWGGATWTYSPSPGGVYRTDILWEAPGQRQAMHHPPGTDVQSGTWWTDTVAQDVSRSSNPLFVQQELCPPPYTQSGGYVPSNQQRLWQTPRGPVLSPTKPTASAQIVPPGYQPKRHNPGGLKFQVYDYTAQTSGGKPLFPPGRGWAQYQLTGRYPG